MSGVKVLFFDVETTPRRSYIWHPKQGWIPHQMLQGESALLSWAAKWRGQKRVMSDVLTIEEAQKQDDHRIIQSLADLVREADIVIAHNVDKFDIRVLNGRVVLAQTEPIGKVQTIDTLKLSQKHFGFAYHKLDYLAKIFFDEHKIKTEFDWWAKCMEGDEASLRKMVRYNRKDVVLLERVFEHILPYVTGTPRLWDPDNKWQCGNCGHEVFQRRGYHRTKAATYAKVQCQGCFRYSRRRTAESNAGEYRLL